MSKGESSKSSSDDQWTSGSTARGRRRDGSNSFPEDDEFNIPEEEGDEDSIDLSFERRFAQQEVAMHRASAALATRRPSIGLVKAMESHYIHHQDEEPDELVEGIIQAHRLSTDLGEPSTESVSRRKLSRHHPSECSATSEKHFQLMNQIKRSIQHEHLGIEVGEPATETIKKRGSEQEKPTTRSLILQIRDLPYAMSAKRQYKRELTLTPDTHERVEPKWEAFIQEIRAKTSDWYKTMKRGTSFWESSFRTIETSFGTAVLSFFIFLRWLLWLNLCLFGITFVFLVLPTFFSAYGEDSRNATLFAVPSPPLSPETLRSEAMTQNLTLREERYSNHYAVTPQVYSMQLFDDQLIKDLGTLINTEVEEDFLDKSLRYGAWNQTARDRHMLVAYCLNVYNEYMTNLTKTRNLLDTVLDFFQGKGWMEKTAMYMGYYLPATMYLGTLPYSTPVAFILVLAAAGILNMVLMISYASEGVRETILEEHQEAYCGIVFCGWDYCVEDKKAADINHDGIYNELRSLLTEERRKRLRKKWSLEDKIKIYSIRSLSTLVNILALVGAYYLLLYVVNWQIKTHRTSKKGNFYLLVVDFLPPLTLTLLNFIIPLFVYAVIHFERYNERQVVGVVLFRIIVLRLASIVMLVGTFYNQIMCNPRDMCDKGYLDCSSPLCWETYVGQQMYRLAVVDMIVPFLVVFLWDTPRNYVVKKYKNKWTAMLGQPIFEIPMEVLNVIYTQTLCWVGLFYCPMLPGLTSLKLVVLFYLKKYTVLKNCAPPASHYKASRSNAIFVVVLLVSFFMAIIVLGYSITEIPPSPSCGPFRFNYKTPNAIRDAIRSWSPTFNDVLMFMFSPLFVTPLVIILCLVLYFYLTKAAANVEMEKVLKVQLSMEGKDKQFLLHRILKINPKFKTLSRRQ